MTTSATLPPGVTVRPATFDDAAAVCALLNEIDLLEIGRADTELAEVQADLKQAAPSPCTSATA